MKKTDVKIGETYLVKVASNLVPVKITSEHTSGGTSGGGGGWEGVSVKTGKTIRIKSVQRLRKRLAGTKSKTDTKRGIAKSATRAKGSTKATREANSATKRNTGKRGATSGQPKAKRTSLLDVAAHILSLGTHQAMCCKDIVKIAIDRKLWAPKTGKTPANTLHAAITREIKNKGASGGSRFRKAERGKFELAK